MESITESSYFTDEITMIKDYLEGQGIEASNLNQMSFSNNTSIWYGETNDARSLWLSKNELFIDHTFNNEIGTFTEAAQTFSRYWLKVADFLKVGNLKPSVNFHIPTDQNERLKFSDELQVMAKYIRSHFVTSSIIAS